MRSMTVRRGMTLAELQVALVVGAIISAAGLAALVHLRRAVDGLVRLESAERVGAEVISVVEAFGRQLRYPIILGDTAIQGELRLAVGVACRGQPTSVTLAPAVAGSLGGMTFLADAPAAGDRLEFFATARDASEVGWHTRQVLGSAWVSSREGCGAGNPFVAPGLEGRPVVRVLHDSLHETARAGTPVEIYRAVRVVVYHAGVSGWVIGLRHCVVQSCGSAQPIVGPVRSPQESGLRFHWAEGVGPIMVAVRVTGIDRTFSGVIPAPTSPH